MIIAKEKLRESTQYKNWIAQLDLRTCQYCRDTHGKIYGISEVVPIPPPAPNRVWYEADINYTRGYRGRERVLFSNDGLIFVTYDHYHTFYEII